MSDPQTPMNKVGVDDVETGQPGEGEDLGKQSAATLTLEEFDDIPVQEKRPNCLRRFCTYLCSCCLCRGFRCCFRCVLRCCCCQDPPPFQWDKRSSNIFGRMGLKYKEIVALAKVFAKIDDDNSGEVSVLEFFEALDMDATPFALRVFSLMDIDDSGQLDFTEFVVAVWNYCTFLPEKLRRFAFDMYDADHGGTLDTREIRKMFEDVCGKQWARSERAAMLVGEIETLALQSGSLSAAVEFRVYSEFVRRTPNLLQPAFHMQLLMQRQLGGLKFWKKLQSRREKAAKKEYKKALQEARGTGRQVVQHDEANEIVNEIRLEKTESKGMEEASDLASQRNAITTLRRQSSSTIAVTPTKPRRMELPEGQAERLAKARNNRADVGTAVHPLLLPARSCESASRKARGSDDDFYRPEPEEGHANATMDDDDDGPLVLPTTYDEHGNEIENAYIIARREAKLDAIEVFDDMRGNLKNLTTLNPDPILLSGDLAKPGIAFLMDDQLNSCTRSRGLNAELAAVRDELQEVLAWQKNMIRSQQLCADRIRGARSSDWVASVHAKAEEEAFQKRAAELRGSMDK